jgi:two-component system cell cycle sensor histidine kinase PleC
VLDLSAVESQRQKRIETDLSLNKLIKETVEIIKGYPQGNEKQYIIKVPENILLKAEDRSMRQIFLNILSNSVKFTKENGIIEISARTNSEHNLRIVIKDNGIGIPKDKIKTLFQPFVQVENVMTKEHKGSGLGLVLIKKLVESYQGTVELSSKLGEGTKMVLIFPKSRVIKTKQGERSCRFLHIQFLISVRPNMAKRPANSRSTERAASCWK